MNLDQFARKMRERLLANRHKDQFDKPAPQDRGPGWRRMPPDQVLELLKTAALDLRASMRSTNAELVLEKAADVAVLAYMCADLAAGDGDNAYLREHLSLAEQITAACIAVVPEIWVCESCNAAEAFDDSGPWHACQYCGCPNFCQTDGTSERRLAPSSGATQSGGS